MYLLINTRYDGKYDWNAIIVLLFEELYVSRTFSWNYTMALERSSELVSEKQASTLNFSILSHCTCCALHALKSVRGSPAYEGLDPVWWYYHFQ